MAVQVEQQYQAELLRQRVREQQIAQELAEEDTSLASTMGSARKKGFSVNTLEAGLGMLFGSIIDLLEFLIALIAPIPFVGWAIAGAGMVVSAIISVILGVLVGLWLFAVKRINPISGEGAIYGVLFGTVFANSVFNWLPAWFAFFLYLFIIAHINAIPFVPKTLKKALSKI
jgi:hypothetical protein